MLGIGAAGQWAIGQVGPVNNPALIGGVRLPLYIQPHQSYPQTQATYWNGIPTPYPAGGSAG